MVAVASRRRPRTPRGSRLAPRDSPGVIRSRTLCRAQPNPRGPMASCQGRPDAFITVDGMLDISGGDPSLRNDDGSAEPGVAAALADFAAGQGTEHAVMTALAGSRLLVPVVAVLADQLDPAEPSPAAEPGAPRSAIHGEKASEMAMPTLIGVDGRRAVPAFTSLDSLSR